MNTCHECGRALPDDNPAGPVCVGCAEIGCPECGSTAECDCEDTPDDECSDCGLDSSRCQCKAIARADHMRDVEKDDRATGGGGA